MRRRFVGMMAGGLVLGLTSWAAAQEGWSAFGGPPAGVVAGPDSGPFPIGDATALETTSIPSVPPGTVATGSIPFVSPGTVYSDSIYYGVDPDISPFPLYAYPTPRYQGPRYGYAPVFVWPHVGILPGRAGARGSR